MRQLPFRVPVTHAVPALLVLFLLAPSCARQQKIEAKQEGGGPVPVATAPAHSKQIQRNVEGIGTLFPFDEAIISAEVDGPVKVVSADLGDAVKEGQIMAQISDEEQRYMVQQNEAQLRQSLERLGLKNEEDKVRDIGQTPDVRKAQADLTEAEQRHRRVRNLTDQGIGSMQDLDQAKTRLDAAQAALDATGNQTRNLIQEVERFRAVVDLGRKKLRDTTVRAPYNAWVKDRQVTVGQYVRANTPLFTLVKLDPIRLRIEIPERMAPWVKSGQVVDVSLEAYQGKKFQGRISRISPTVDAQKRTFIVEALIANPGGTLKPGSYARAHVPTELIERITVVPLRAVNYVLGSNKAYIIKDNIVDAREVKLGDRFDTEIEILEGVEDGEIVATSNLSRIDTGSRIRIAQAAEEKKAPVPKPAE